MAHDNLSLVNANFRGGGKVGKKAVEQSYAVVLSALTLQLGGCHGLAGSGHPEPLRYIICYVVYILDNYYGYHATLN